MLRFMLDSDICSYIMKRSNRSALDISIKIPVDEICISAITKAEQLSGMQTHPRKDRAQLALDAFLLHIQVLDFPSAAAADYTEIRAELKARGTPIGGNDLLIAAHARHHNLILVTNNIREFQRVPALKLENWTEPQP